MVEEARGRALRSGLWKPILCKKRLELYDLASDVGEQVDVSADHLARVQELGASLDALEQDPLGVRGDSGP